jgi:beta-xylosidase
MSSPPASSAPSGQAGRKWRVPVVGVLGILVLVAVVTAVLVAGGPSNTGPSPSAVPALPRLGPIKIVYNGDVGDPFVLTTSAPATATASGSKASTGASAGYQLFGTDDWPDHVPTAHSQDLATWQNGPDALPVLPGWADPTSWTTGTWAPAALTTTHGYLLYISLLDEASHRHCIAVTSAPNSAGPYHDAIGHPLVCQTQLGGVIDPSVTRDKSGGLHLVWKSDPASSAQAAALWEQNLSSDGLQLTGQPHRLLIAAQPWQAGIIENPALIPASGGGWWLFYSGNRYDSAGYATGLAYCPNIDGPCRETADRPFLAGTPNQYSPGGLDFFRDSQGHLWAAFATWSRPPRNGRFYCCRPLNIAPVLRS